MGQIKNGTNDWSEMDWLAYRIMADIDHYKYWCTPKSTLGPEVIKLISCSTELSMKF